MIAWFYKSWCLFLSRWRCGGNPNWIAYNGEVQIIYLEQEKNGKGKSMDHKGGLYNEQEQIIKQDKQ